MPTYDYVCDACEHAFELFQQMTDAVKRKCPECGRLRLRRLVGTGSGVIFKGSGFYQTDYRSDSYKKDAKADEKKPEKKKDSAGGSKKDSSKASGSSTTKSDGATKRRSDGG